MKYENYLFCYSWFGKYFGTLGVICHQNITFELMRKAFPQIFWQSRLAILVKIDNYPSFWIGSITVSIKNPLQKTSEQSILEILA